jgi:putative flippase GtrA
MRNPPLPGVPSSKGAAQFARFCLVGALGFAVDAGVLMLCLRVLDLGLYEGRFVSFLVAATVTWKLNRQFTFRNARSDRPHSQWARYVVANGLGGTANFAAYALVVGATSAGNAYPVLGVAAGSLAGLLLNFTSSRLLVFRVPKQGT